MRLRQVSLGLVLSCALVGCAGDGVEGGGVERQNVAAVTVPDRPTELPEGDPGPGAPEAPEPEPEAEAEEEEGHDEHGGEALSTVPSAALLDAETVGGIAGGSWTAAPGSPVLQPGPCREALSGPDAGGSRTHVLTDGTGRRLVMTVTSYAHGADADAVAALAAALPGCGWETGPALRLGEASTAASRQLDGGTVHLTAVSAEGALVVVTGEGGLGSDDPELWEAVADAAIGTACSAAPEGCH